MIPQGQVMTTRKMKCTEWSDPTIHVHRSQNWTNSAWRDYCQCKSKSGGPSRKAKAWESKDQKEKLNQKMTDTKGNILRHAHLKFIYLICFTALNLGYRMGQKLIGKSRPSFLSILTTDKCFPWLDSMYSKVEFMLVVMTKCCL